MCPRCSTLSETERVEASLTLMMATPARVQALEELVASLEADLRALHYQVKMAIANG